MGLSSVLAEVDVVGGHSDASRDCETCRWSVPCAPLAGYGISTYCSPSSHHQLNYSSSLRAFLDSRAGKGEKGAHGAVLSGSLTGWSRSDCAVLRTGF